MASKNTSTPANGLDISRKITLDGIWDDFYKKIRESAGNGLIVRVDKNAGKEEYTRFHKEHPSLPDKFRLMFAYEFSQYCTSPSAAGQLMHGVQATKHSGASAALNAILERFSGGMNISALEREQEYIENVIRKTFAAKLYLLQTQDGLTVLSQDKLDGIAVSEKDYQALCSQLMAIFVSNYANHYTEDTRYSWLFSNTHLNDDARIIRYLVALLCAALVSLDTESGDRAKLIQKRESVRENVIRYLAVSDPSPPEPQLQKHIEKIPLKNRTAWDDSVPFGLTEEEYNDRKTVAISVRQIRADYPGIDAAKLAEELSGFLEAAKAAFSAVWDQYSRKERALEIVRSYYEEYELGPFDANHQTTIGGHHGR